MRRPGVEQPEPACPVCGEENVPSPETPVCLSGATTACRPSHPRNAAVLRSLPSFTCKATADARGSFLRRQRNRPLPRPVGRARQCDSLCEPERLRRERTWLGRGWLGPTTAGV